MSTRITLSILLTTWLILVVGQAAAFWTARASLLALLDDTLITRATRALEAATHASAGAGDAHGGGTATADGAAPTGFTAAGSTTAGSATAAVSPSSSSPSAAAPHAHDASPPPPHDVPHTHADRPVLPAGDYYTVRSTAGAVVARSGGQRGTLRPTLTRAAFEVDPTTGARVRTIEMRMFLSRDGRRVQYAITYSRPAGSFDRLLGYVGGMLLAVSVTCGLTAALLALRLSRAALRPLRETAEVIAGIDERHLSHRLDAERMPAELKPIARRLNEMLQRLQGVLAQREQFLANAAHELRTPTAALLTTLEVALRRPRDAAALTDALRNGLADARRLRKLVEALMEHARGDHAGASAAAAAPSQPIDVVALIRECTRLVEPLARERRLTIHHDLPPVLELVAQHDRLRSVLVNLLSNAVEYNRPGGSITVRCGRARHGGGTRAAGGDERGDRGGDRGGGGDGEGKGNGDGGGPDDVKIAVADTGVGIPPEQVAHVFEPFYRGGSGGSGAGPGDDAAHLGLGLFLVRSHVEAMHGRCRIDSEVGVGTTVVVSLPNAEPATDDPAAVTAAAAAGPQICDPAAAR